MLAKRVVACLDVRDGRVVKGVRFADLRDAGSPLECARRYCAEGIDELVLLDVSATLEGRLATRAVIESVADSIDVPLTVGGGVRSVEDIASLLGAGADKVSMNSAALERPELLAEGARRFGAQCIVLAIDVARGVGREFVATHAGNVTVDRNPVEWAARGARSGAGEILLTSIAHDGREHGFDCDLIARVSASVDIPVIASGGARDAASFAEAFAAGADAALGATCFHYGKVRIADVKRECDRRGFVVRP